MKKYLFRCALLGLLLALAGISGLNAQSDNQGSIGGNIFSDTDGDAQVDEGEGKSSGQKIKLYRILDDGTRVLVAEVTTDAQGNYNFSSLPVGSYTLVFEFTSGVRVETAAVITLTAEAPSFVQTPIPFLPETYATIYGSLTPPKGLPGSPTGTGTLDALNLRNPANLTGEEVSRFAP